MTALDPSDVTQALGAWVERGRFPAVSLVDAASFPALSHDALSRYVALAVVVADAHSNESASHAAVAASEALVRAFHAIAMPGPAGAAIVAAEAAAEGAPAPSPSSAGAGLSRAVRDRFLFGVMNARRYRPFLDQFGIRPEDGERRGEGGQKEASGPRAVKSGEGRDAAEGVLVVVEGRETAPTPSLPASPDAAAPQVLVVDSAPPGRFWHDATVREQVRRGGGGGQGCRLVARPHPLPCLPASPPARGVQEEVETWLEEIAGGTAPVQRRGVLAGPQRLANALGSWLWPAAAAAALLLGWAVWRLVVVEACRSSRSAAAAAAVTRPQQQQQQQQLRAPELPGASGGASPESLSPSIVNVTRGRSVGSRRSRGDSRGGGASPSSGGGARKRSASRRPPPTSGGASPRSSVSDAGSLPASSPLASDDAAGGEGFALPPCESSAGPVQRVTRRRLA